jgi:flagellar biosynthesis protein FliR
MHADAMLTWATLFGFLFTLARISCVIAFFPLAALKGVPDTAKIVLSLAFTFILWPEWKGPVAETVTIGRIVSGLASEAALGLAIGLAFAIAFEVFVMAAQFVSFSVGLTFASSVDPTSGADSTVLLTIAQLTTGLLFFVSGADRLFVRALADSLRLCPPESFSIHQSWTKPFIDFSATILSTGLRLAAPVMALVLLADFVLAVLGKVQAQVHLLSLTMPVKLGAGLALLAVTISLQPAVFESLMASSIRLIEGLFRSAAHG